MKKLLTALLLLPIASDAVDWVDLGKSSDKQVQTFLDYDSVKRQDMRVMGRSSFRSLQDQPKYLSAIFQSTYINNNPVRKKDFITRNNNGLSRVKTKLIFSMLL